MPKKNQKSFTSYTKIDLKMDHRYKCKAKTIKFLEQNMGETFWDLWGDKDS